MTGYECYCLYHSLKLHFENEKYDFFRYNGKIKIGVTAFEHRKDKWHFYKLSRKISDHDQMVDFIVANILELDKIWIGSLLEEEAEVNYRKHQKVMQSLSYCFDNDCNKAFANSNPTIMMTMNDDSPYPPLLTKTLQGEIAIESLCLMNLILNFIPKWDKIISDTIFWPNYRLKMLKYTSFMPKDTVKYKLILKKVIHGN